MTDERRAADPSGKRSSSAQRGAAPKKPSSWWARLRKLAARLVGWFPLSWVGLLVVGGCSLALFHYGLGRIDLILLALGAIGLGIAALALVLSILAALLIWWHARRAKEGEGLRAECGYWVGTDFSVPSLWYIPFIHVSWSWVSPDAKVRLTRKRRRLHEHVQAHRRDTTETVVRRFTVGDIFGLSSITFEQQERRAVRLLPWVGGLRQMHVVRGMAGGDELSHPEGPAAGDRIDMRRYAPGDPIRFVLWKVFAKSRDLIVRTPERAISPARQTVAYLVASNDDEAAAGAARVAVDGGALGDEWKLGADGARDVAESKEGALEVLTRSARATAAQSGAGLSAFLDSAATGRVGRAVVFVPSRPGPWLDRVIAAARDMGGRSARVEFVVGTDGVRRNARGTWWSRAALAKGLRHDFPVAADPTDADDLRTVLRKLGGARLNVLVVDRPEGRVFTEHHLGVLRS